MNCITELWIFVAFIDSRKNYLCSYLHFLSTIYDTQASNYNSVNAVKCQIKNLTTVM